LEENKVAHILDRYARDFGGWSHGMPDLFLWNKDTGEAKFVEVKSETDRLSDMQKAWIAYLTQGMIKVEVWYVKDVYHPEAVEVF
jgi:fanconi-associated nuclease 1